MNVPNLYLRRVVPEDGPALTWQSYDACIVLSSVVFACIVQAHIQPGKHMK